MNKEDKNTHRMIGQMILVDHILEKRRIGKAFRARTAPPRPKTSRPKSVRPKTTRPELEKKLEEDEDEEETFPSWLQNRKTFRSIMNESVETIVNNNKALTTYFYKQKSRPSLATSFKVKQYASINDLERILNARKRESERREQESCADRRKSDDLVTKKHLLRSLTRNTELEREFEQNASNNQQHHHKVRNSSLHHRRSSNLSLGVSSSSTKHKWNWKRRWTEQMMARHLSRSDLRMLRVLREASEQDQMRRKLERIRIKESHEKNHMKLHLSTTTSQSGDSNQNEDIFEMVEKDGEVEKNGTQKTRTSIETPRSRFLRECSESMELTGPQMFGIAVLKRDD